MLNFGVCNVYVGVRGFGFWIFDVGYWISDFGSRNLDFMDSILEFGIWFLDGGFTEQIWMLCV